ncbi:hypothetical protein [Roseovarius sp. SYSU LYC5161]|uniref:hypothetical protein n=1 Tax=Roseovarius halophilus (ex Wu et al. 2025) TaxID=3376060 RepID=UPI00399A1947
MSTQMTFQTNGNSKLLFQTREERIVAFFVQVVSGTDGFKEKIGRDLTSNIDEATCQGEVSAPARALRNLLDFFCLAAVDISLQFSREDFLEGVEGSEILRLFDGLDQRVPHGQEIELSIYEMLSEEQRLSVRKAVFHLGKQLPSLLQYDEIPELAST